MGYGVPARICPACGEYEPHSCAPEIAFASDRRTGRLVVLITDRPVSR